MNGDPKTGPKRGEDKVPRPPSRKEVEEISRAQEMITDDWTGEGGRPPKRPDDPPDRR